MLGRLESEFGVGGCWIWKKRGGNKEGREAFDGIRSAGKNSASGRRGWESGCTIIWMRGLALVLIGLVAGVCAYEKALAQPHARPMDFTGRPLAGMVYVDPGGYETDAALAKWVKRGVDFESALPAEGLRRLGAKTQQTVEAD